MYFRRCNQPLLSKLACLIGLISAFQLALRAPLRAQEALDLSQAAVIIHENSEQLPAAEKIAPTILIEEVAKRSNLTWKTTSTPVSSSSAKIFLANKADLPAWKNRIPNQLLDDPVLKQSEGYVLHVHSSLKQPSNPSPEIWIIGSDARGLMFGVGRLLRELQMLDGHVTLTSNLHIASAPDRAIRGHQIGYRPRANSWDAWTIDQFDQYFRDMVVFGANCMENIPFQDNDPHPLMKYPREQMNIEFAKLCMKYDLDHWLWVPVEFTVADEPDKCETFLQQQADFYAKCPRLDAIFVPGGDPGHNPSASLMPYLAKMAQVAQKYHPKAKIWVSLQGFKGKEIDDFYEFLNKHQPDWFDGAVMGPSSPSMESTRRRLPSRYPLRWYPDITHIVRCQYPIPWLDPAWGITVGREGVNPRPQDYAAIYQNDYRLTDGFLSYTDGINDDFNKNLWTAMAWDPNRPIQEFAKDYARYFFRSDLAETGSAALFGLEENLRGPAATNGSVAGTLKLWQHMEDKLPENQRNWRFDMHLFRAYFDAYTQTRLLYERQLEQRALEHLSNARKIGVPTALQAAREQLEQASKTTCDNQLFSKVEKLADRLFETISYQTSVPKYGASGYERGCMMDYVNFPLNNRWWIEDQLEKASKLPNVTAQLEVIERVVNFENPGRGGYYESIGHVEKSLHVIKLQNAGDAMRHYTELPMPTQRNIGPDRNGLRLSFHIYMDQLPTLKFNALDPRGKYTVRLYAQRESPLQIDGQLAKKMRTGDQFDQVTEQEFEVPASALEDGKLDLSWAPLDERHLNWRQKHYVTDVWLIRHSD